MVHYACGLIRDQFNRFLVSTSKDDKEIKIGYSTLSVEAWVNTDETPIKALNSELYYAFGIRNTNILNMVKKKEYERMGTISNQKISVFLFDIVKPVTFAPGPAYAVGFYTKDQIRAMTLNKDIEVSARGKTVLAHIDALIR